VDSKAKVDRRNSILPKMYYPYKFAGSII